MSNSAAEDLAGRLNRIEELTDYIMKFSGDHLEQQRLASRIHREIVAARDALKVLKPLLSRVPAKD